MRVGIDARCLTGKWQYRGIAKYTRILIQNLKENNIECILYSWPSIHWDKEYEIIQFGSKNYLIWENVSFPKRVKQDKIKTIFCPLNTAPLFTQLNIYTIIHDLIAVNQKNLKSIYKSLNLRLNNGKFIAVSQTTKNKLHQAKHHAVIAYLPNIITQVYWTKDKSPVRSDYIFCITGTSKTKNLGNTLKAFEYYRAIGGLLKLKILGNKNFIKHCLKRCKISAESISHITIIESGISNQEIISYYRNCKIFLFISLDEGFGIPLLEAVHNNCTIVRSDIPIFNEILSKEGYSVNPKDIKEISNTILIAEKEQKTVNKSIIKEYTLETYSQLLEKFLSHEKYLIS